MRRIVHIVWPDGGVIVTLPVDLLLPIITATNSQEYDGDRGRSEVATRNADQSETKRTLAEAPL